MAHQAQWTQHAQQALQAQGAASAVGAAAGRLRDEAAAGFLRKSAAAAARFSASSPAVGAEIARLEMLVDWEIDYFKYRIAKLYFCNIPFKKGESFSQVRDLQLQVVVNCCSILIVKYCQLEV